MTPKIELDSKEVRKIIAKYLGIPESSVTPNRYTFSVTGISAEEIQKKLN